MLKGWSKFSNIPLGSLNNTISLAYIAIYRIALKARQRYIEYRISPYFLYRDTPKVSPV